MVRFRILILYWLTVVSCLTYVSVSGYARDNWTSSSRDRFSSVRLGRSHVSLIFKSNISSWKYPQYGLSFIGIAPDDEYDDLSFRRILGSLMSISHEDDEEYYPYGMYPYLFAGTNPYQYGQSEANVFQKEALVKNATKTTVESILSVGPFYVYIFLWLYIELLAILILPLVGFILFRFFVLPLGELIGGKHTRSFLRYFVIRVEKHRRHWITWLWPKNRILPPWRFRTPKILRHDNEGSIPWELMEEKELRKFNMRYPERWQLDKRQQKWKQSAKNPDCYAEKWVFKMIRRKLRHRSFYPATDKFKWGEESMSSTSSGMSTSSEDELDDHKTGQPSRSETESKFDLSLGTGTMESLSKLHLVNPEGSHVTVDIESVATNEKTGQPKETHKKRRKKDSAAKRTFADELHSLKSSHRGIILDQTDKRWPNYTGVIYDEGYDHHEEDKASKPKLKGWQYLKMGLGARKQFETGINKLKPARTKLVLKKREIDALARGKTAVSGDLGPSMLKTSATKTTYNLAVLQKIRKKNKVGPSKSEPLIQSDGNVGKNVGKTPGKRRASFFSSNKKTDKMDEKTHVNKKQRISNDEGSHKMEKRPGGERKVSIFGSRRKSIVKVPSSSQEEFKMPLVNQKRPNVKLILPDSETKIKPRDNDSISTDTSVHSNKTFTKVQTADTGKLVNSENKGGRK